MESVAHMKDDGHGGVISQSLSAHLQGTAEQAKTFAEEFGNGDWGYFLGSSHDLGKYSPDWQGYIRREYCCDDIDQTKGTKRVYHSLHGALNAFLRFPSQYKRIARAISYIIAGHHAGLADWSGTAGSLDNRLFDTIRSELRREEMNPILGNDEARAFLDQSLPSSPPFGSPGRCDPQYVHLWIRMLFSCLVDADFLDTEAFMTPENTDKRGVYPKLSELKKRFDAFIEEKQATAEPSVINKKRNEVLWQCREAAQKSPGFFSLTVPTGGGKTLSSMAFALEHALKWDKQRVIMAIPYTSIIEQTAKVYKYGTDDDSLIPEILKTGQWLFGEDAVLEHHSNLDPEKETLQSRLASENWDAPVIVTTNVQLFESLFASRTSACRKLHNLTNSIIILDEAQMLPPEYLKPILSVLRGLVEHLKVTVVLCTATQPALKGRIGADSSAFDGILNCTEITNDAVGLTRDFKRVNVFFPKSPSVLSSWEDVARRLSDLPQTLCIVNTRADCRTLHSLMPEGTVHLSALMCPEERSDVISNVKATLRQKSPVRVVSTQLIEAGVDIDFPVVFRALGGMDSIAQAAGRCNREGRLESPGEVHVFMPPKPVPRGLLRKAADACSELLRTRIVAELTPDIYEKYFNIFYSSINTFDAPDFQNIFIDNADECKFQFRTFANNFKLINNEGQKAILVNYEGKFHSSCTLLDLLRRKGPESWILRKLQRFSVNVPDRVAEVLKNKGAIEDVRGYLVQQSTAMYRPGLGLLADSDVWDAEQLIL